MSDAGSTIGATPVRELLRRSRAGVVVLERIARGAGETRWYFVQSEPQLEALVPLLAPGSVVSFYFDGRVRRERFSPALESMIMGIVEETGDAAVGLLASDEMTLEMESIAGPNDLAEFTSMLGPDSTVFVGAFPAPESDGANAVTVVLPDVDGAIRDHPH
jgi:hypothetical protein